MTKSKDYQKRLYREWSGKGDLMAQEIIIKETDLFIFADKDIRDIAEKIVKRYRAAIETYAKKRPEFLTSIEPLSQDNEAADIIKEMLRTTALAGVGPMASVAGAIAEFTGNELSAYSSEIIIENGGDVFIKSDKERVVAIYAGDSALSNKLSLRIKPDDTPIGVCTSSGTVGHSLSFGKADACVIISKSATLADAVATAACNRIKEKADIEKALRFAVSIEGVKGAVAILGENFGSIGSIELT